jgi:hypothetical protein
MSVNDTKADSPHRFGLDCEPPGRQKPAGCRSRWQPPRDVPFFANGFVREDSMSVRTVPCILAAAVFMAFGFPPADAQQKPQPPQSLRLYVLDCGKITPASVEQYGLKPSEMANTEMITPCFLIVHPRGTMIWDTGEIPDGAFQNGVSLRS